MVVFEHFQGRTGRIHSKFPNKNELVVSGINVYREEYPDNNQRHMMPRKERYPNKIKGVYSDKGSFKCTDISHVDYQLGLP